MKQTFLVTVSVGDDCSPADVAKDIEFAIAETDGEQHVEHINWEPIRMLNPTVTPVAQIKVANAKDFRDPTKYHGVLMEETRTKLFVRTHEDRQDSEDGWWKFQAELVARARDGELHSHFNDVPGFRYQYNGGYIDKDGVIQDTLEWKDFPNDSTRGTQIPIEEI